jgi:VCBS repeat-containing protein
VTLAADGTFTYTPAPDFNGTDSFTYTASDGTAVSNLATVTIAVTAVNDAPVARHDTATVTEDSAGTSGNVLGNDTDVDPGTTLIATLDAGPANGTVTLASNGTYTYRPNTNFNGPDSFTYTASDGAAVSNVATVTIAVTAVNDAPLAVNDTASTAQGTAVSGTVLGNDTDVDPGTTLTATLGASPANGTVTLTSGGSFTYTPNASFSGSDSFTYTASDGTAASNVATVTITVTPASNPVVFFDDFENARGWTTNPNGTDTAVTGQWERGNPESTTSTGTKQLGTTVSGVNGLVTGRLAGTSVGSFDIDNGSTTIQSPAIVLPSSGNLTLTFSYYLAHLLNSSTADYLRVTIVGTTTAVVFQELGAANNDDAAWAAASVNLNAFAGQTIRIRIEAADAGSASLVEAAIDDVKIIR